MHLPFQINPQNMVHHSYKAADHKLNTVLPSLFFSNNEAKVRLL